MTESVIDFPKDSLCPEIWDKVVDSSGVNEVWLLKPEVRAVLQGIFEKIVEATKQHFNIIHITGSITSNSYTKNADIDMHLLSDLYEVDEVRAEEINKLVKSAFKQIVQQYPDCASVGSHPIEVFYLPNRFQDLMSVGCYDFFNQKWLVGPELTDKRFNPYSEYYAEVLKRSSALSSLIRDMILRTYEAAVVLKKNVGSSFLKQAHDNLVNALADVQDMYDNIRKMRKVYSSPTSVEQALKFRQSKKWKIADASFKLFDKYGYMAILKQFIESYGLISNSVDVDEEVSDDVISTVKRMIGNVDKLLELSIDEQQQVDEGVRGAIASLALAFACAIPGKVDAKTVDAAAKSQKSASVIEQKKLKFQKTLSHIDMTKKFGDWTAVQAVNVLALTLFGEGRSELDNGGMTLIVDSIINRCKDGDVSEVAGVCSARSPKSTAYQYSYWNGNSTALNLIKRDVVIVPSQATNALEFTAWEKCIDIATNVVAGAYKVSNKNINSYYVTGMKNPPSWTKKMTHVTVKGKHTFGYYQGNDPKWTDMTKVVSRWKLKTPEQLTQEYQGQYVVLRGDSIDKIAKKFKVPAGEMIAANSLSNPDALKVGLTLLVPDDKTQAVSNTKLQLLPNVASSKTVTVRRGDSLSKIAKANGTTVDRLIQLNHIKDKNKLRIGQVLRI